MPKTTKVPFWKTVEEGMDAVKYIDLGFFDMADNAKDVRRYARLVGNTEVAAKMDAFIARMSEMMEEVARMPEAIVAEARKLDDAPETTAYEHGGRMIALEPSDDENED